MSDALAGIDTTGWPQSLRDLVELIDVAAALRFIDAYAGRDYVYIPVELDEGHHLIQAIGETAARQLVDAAAGDRFPVPTMAVRRGLERKRLIREAVGPTHEVAKRLGVSPRWVREVRNEPRDDDRQMDLFSEK